MKSILLSLCTAYQFSNAQIPQYVPISPQPPQPPQPLPIATTTTKPGPEFVPIVPAPPAPPVIDPPVIDPLPLPTDPGAPGAPGAPATPTTTAGVVAPPAGQAYGAFGQLCDTSPRALCSSATVGLASSGIVSCLEPSSCCLCSYIECTNCGSFVAGQKGIFGVGKVSITGTANSGAQLVCQGLQSCSEAIIEATNVRTLAMSGVQASLNGAITVTNPTTDFKIECTSKSSCEGLKLEIVIPAAAPGAYCGWYPSRISGIQCSGTESCKNMDVTIRNSGCGKLIVEKLECTTPDACLGANFNIIGDVDIANCELGTSGHTATGLSKCYQNLQALLCQEPGACRGMIKTLTNPARAFSMQCGDVSSCQAAQITLNFDASPWFNFQTGQEFAEPTTWIEGFKFSGEASGAGAVIKFNNNQRGKTLEVENVECSAMNACSHTTFILGKDVELGEVKCQPGACYNCLVKVMPTDPGTPCIEFMNI